MKTRLGMLLAILLTLAPRLRANSLITDPGVGQLGTTAGNNTLGFDFTVGPQPIQVTALGLWDYVVQNGLQVPHEVGLWNSSGNLLAIVVIPSGMTAPLDGQFRYQALTSPVTLFAGQKYVMGGHYPAGNSADALTVHFNGDQAVFDGAVIPGHTRYFEMGGFTFPAQDGGFGSEVGPNAIFTVIPEPSAPILLLVSAAVVALSRRKVA